MSIVNDPAHIPRIVETYSDMMIRLAYQRLGSMSDAEDAVQDVFIRLLRQPSFTDETHMKAWLIRVTINRCKDIGKSGWFQRTTALSEEDIPALEAPDRALLGELTSLPDKDRTVLYLYYYEGYSVSEVAKILGANENTVSSRLTRARKKFKDVLLEGGYPV